MIDSWLELSLETTPELAEAISDALHDHVDGGVVMEQLNDPQRSFDRWEDEHATGPVIIRGYIPNDDTLEARKERVEFAIRCMNMVMSDQHTNPSSRAAQKKLPGSGAALAAKPNPLGGGPCRGSDQDPRPLRPLPLHCAEPFRLLA